MCGNGVHALTRAVVCLTMLALFAPKSSGAAYEVGPGKSYASIGAVPWNTLQPGDGVYIYYRSIPYTEKVLLSASGTASQPIRIVGVPGPNGELPIIDGKGATTSPVMAFPHAVTENRGLFTISIGIGQPWGYKPSFIQIVGLEFRNACTPNTFTDEFGASQSYTNNAAGVYVERGENITVQNCTIDGNGNGLFVSSGESEPVVSRHILVDSCFIYGNGNVGSQREHNIYTEAIDITFQYNRILREKAGALGNALKDRSAGTVVRYNWIEGGAHSLDLVEPQASVPVTTIDPSFRQTYVYGNVITSINGDGTNPIHYGGDNGNPAIYRKGWLYFYNNTFVNVVDQIKRWRTMFIRLETNGESCDFRNNIIYNASLTPGLPASELSILDLAGNCVCGTNYVSPKWIPSHGGMTFTGTISGTNSFLVDSTNKPGFVNVATNDVRLAATSICLNRSDPAVVPAQYTTQRVYAPNCGGEARVLNGASLDLGAYELGTPSNPTYSISGSVMSGANAIPGATVSIGAVSATTSSTGAFTLNGLRGGTYVVFASLAGRSFSAPQVVTVGPGNAAAVNFGEVFAVSGSATNPDGTPMGGVTITMGSQTIVTAADGSYVFGGLNAGTYTLSASEGVSTFTGPFSATVGPSKVGVNFKRTSYNISGKVTAQGVPVSGAWITAGNFMIPTEPDGTFFIEGLAPGTYSVSAVDAGASFNGPFSVKVGPDAVNVNFLSTHWLTTMTIKPTIIKGGWGATGTVTLNAAAPTGGVFVSLYTSDPTADFMKAYVFIAAGKTSGTFNIVTGTVTSNVVADITASYGGVDITVPVTVTP